MWEASAAVQSHLQDSPSRSTAANASQSDSFISNFDVCDTKNALHASPPHVSEFRKRQLIVAVTANSAECEKVHDGGFDEICAKPLARADIYKVITRHFQHQ